MITRAAVLLHVLCGAGLLSFGCATSKPTATGPTLLSTPPVAPAPPVPAAPPTAKVESAEAPSEVIVPTGPDPWCQQMKVKGLFLLQLNAVQLRPLLQTVADMTCLTFVVAPGASATVSVHPSDDDHHPEWTSDQAFAAVVAELNSQDVTVEPDGPARYRVSGPPPCVAANRVAQFVRSRKQLSENEHEVSRKEVLRIWRDLSCFAKGARMVPTFRDGKASGYHFSRMDPQSLQVALGLRNNDVVRVILIDGNEAGPDVTGQLLSAAKVTLVIERDRQPARIDLVLK